MLKYSKRRFIIRSSESYVSVSSSWHIKEGAFDAPSHFYWVMVRYRRMKEESTVDFSSDFSLLALTGLLTYPLNPFSMMRSLSEAKA